MQSLKQWRLLRAGLSLSAALAATACATLAARPASAPAALSGEWQRDAANSDDFERKLAPVIENQRRRMLPRHDSAVASGSRRGGAGRDGVGSRNDDLDALLMPPEDPDKVRARLAEDLRPPTMLLIAVDTDTVDIAGDAEPVRRFLPGQSVARIDSSGAASLASGWDQRAFVIRAHYTNRASRSWRYELDPATGLLRVSFEANDPEFGKFSLQTRYRRTVSTAP